MSDPASREDEGRPPEAFEWSEDLRRRFLAAKVADVCDALRYQGRNVRLADAALRPVLPFTQLAGPAITVRTYLAQGDGNYDEQAIRMYELGRTCHAPVMVLRCDVPDFVNIGGGAAFLASKHGYSGIVVHGMSRDSDELRELGFPVFSLGLRPDSVRYDKMPDGASIHFEFGRPMEVAGQTVRSGDIVVADHDGAVFLSPDEVQPVIDYAEGIVTWEKGVFRKFEQGMPLIEALEKPQA